MGTGSTPSQWLNYEKFTLSKPEGVSDQLINSKFLNLMLDQAGSLDRTIVPSPLGQPKPYESRNVEHFFHHLVVENLDQSHGRRKLTGLTLRIMLLIWD